MGDALRRAPTAMELAAATDFEQVQATYEDQLAQLIEQWQAQVTPAQQEELAAQVTAIITAGGLAALASMSVGSAVGAALLLTFMTAIAAKAADEMVVEALRQGVKAPPAEVDPQQLEVTAVATAAVLASGLSSFAGKVALAQAGPGVSPEKVAAEVSKQVGSLSDAALKEQLGGALTEAQNAGRMAVVEKAPKPKFMIASEVLDRNICAACKKIDGTKFDTLAEAQRAYPSGWYRLCQGQQRCRGMVLTVWNEDAVAASAGTIPTNADRDWDIRVTTSGAAVDDQAATDTLEPVTTAGGEPNEGPPPAPIANPATWQGGLVLEGTDTGDGRHFSEGALTWPDLDQHLVPLQWQKETSHGGDHDVTVCVGRIDKIWRDGNKLMGRGVFDLGHEDGREAHRRVSERFLRGISIVPDSIANADVELVYPEGTSAGDDPFGHPEKVIFRAGRIRSATLCDIPAFIEADIQLIDGSEGGPVATSGDEASAVAASAHVITLASVPPAEWFDEPIEEPDIGALTITDEGRIFGYLAPAGVVHRGRQDRITVPLRTVDYSTFNNRPAFVDRKGKIDQIAAGVITMGCGHASTSSAVDSRAALDHYDNSCSVVARVRVGENARGAWVAGALLSDVSSDQVERMLACQLSGDWRPHRQRSGWTELTAALVVPVPGFPKAHRPSLRITDGQLVASSVPIVLDGVADPGALVASGGLVVEHKDDHVTLQAKAAELAKRFAEKNAALASK